MEAAAKGAAVAHPEVLHPEVVSAGGKEADAAEVADQQAWALMEMSNEALNRRNFLAGLAFAAAAASIIMPELADAAQITAQDAAQLASPDLAGAAAVSASGVDW